MNDNRKPITILTGFLGSGKTTLLNQLIKDNPGIRIAVIENELAKYAFDVELINEAVQEIDFYDSVLFLDSN